MSRRIQGCQIKGHSTFKGRSKFTKSSNIALQGSVISGSQQYKTKELFQRNGPIRSPTFIDRFENVPASYSTCSTSKPLIISHKMAFNNQNRAPRASDVMAAAEALISLSLSNPKGANTTPAGESSAASGDTNVKIDFDLDMARAAASLMCMSASQSDSSTPIGKDTKLVIRSISTHIGTDADTDTDYSSTSTFMELCCPRHDHVWCSHSGHDSCAMV